MAKSIKVTEAQGATVATYRTAHKRQLNCDVVSDKPSLTVPGESMSIEEIIRRSGMGLPNVGKEPIFMLTDDDESDAAFESFISRELDLTEIDQIKQEREAYKKSLEGSPNNPTESPLDGGISDVTPNEKPDNLKPSESTT